MDQSIISEIKENIGNPIIISLAGSRAWGFNKSESNYDYSCVVENKNIKPGKKYFKQLNNNNIFYIPIESLYYLEGCSNIFFLQDMNNIIYSNSLILNFIQKNKKNIMNMAPNYTYALAIDSIDNDKNHGNEFQYRQIQFAEILKNFYYYGDFSKSLKLSDETKNFCRELKDGKNILSESELNQYLEILYTQSFKDYFSAFEPDEKLHQEFVKVLNEGGELNGIT